MLENQQKGRSRNPIPNAYFLTPRLFDNNIPYWHEEIEGGNGKYLLSEGDQE